MTKNAPDPFLNVGLKNTTNIERIEPPSCSDGLCFGCSLLGVLASIKQGNQKEVGGINMKLVPLFSVVLSFYPLSGSERGIAPIFIIKSRIVGILLRVIYFLLENGVRGFTSKFAMCPS